MKFVLPHAKKAHIWTALCIAPLILDLGARSEWVDNSTPGRDIPQKIIPKFIEYEAGFSSEAVWTFREGETFLPHTELEHLTYPTAANRCSHYPTSALTFPEFII